MYGQSTPLEHKIQPTFSLAERIIFLIAALMGIIFCVVTLYIYWDVYMALSHLQQELQQLRNGL